MVSNSTCPPHADAAFGPAVDVDCRGGFDFTLLFEQSILTLIPAAFCALAFPFRIFYLFRRQTLTNASFARHAKLVWQHSVPQIACAHLLTGFGRLLQ